MMRKITLKYQRYKFCFQYQVAAVVLNTKCEHVHKNKLMDRVRVKNVHAFEQLNGRHLL